MKKILVVAVAMIFATSFSQEKEVTSLEEYNYLTQGYKIALETGVDFKTGYDLKKIDEDKFGDYSVSYHLFKNLESNKTKAILLVLKKDKDKADKIIYMCLPFNNGDLFKKFAKDTESLGASMQIYFNYSMYNTLAKAMEKLTNR
jgi:hypothetical protein